MASRRAKAAAEKKASEERAAVERASREAERKVVAESKVVEALFDSVAAEGIEPDEAFDHAAPATSGYMEVVSEETLHAESIVESEAMPIEEESEAVTIEAATEDIAETTVKLAEELATPEPAAVDEGLHVPSMDEVISHGYSYAEAEIIVRAAMLATHGPGYTEQSLEPAYVVSCPRKGGMWRIGRHFTKEPTKLVVTELTEAECKTLDALIDSEQTHLKIEKANF